MSQSELQPTPGENFCLTHCNGACCRNMNLSVGRTDLYEGFIATLPPDSLIAKVSLAELNVITDERNQHLGGFYYAELGEGLAVGTINGPCANQREDGSCGIYNTRAQLCKSLEVGSPTCVAVRGKRAQEHQTQKRHLPILPWRRR